MANQEEPLFEEKSVTVRSREYTLRELSGSEYDKAEELALKEDGSLNQVVLMRALIAKALIEPKMTAAQIGELPMRTITVLAGVVNDLNSTVPEQAPEGKA